MTTLVPEVIGSPSPQGVVVVAGNNLPPSGVKKKDAWYVPAHCPLFSQAGSNTELDRYGVPYVTAFVDPTANMNDPFASSGDGISGKVVGVSIDGE